VKEDPEAPERAVDPREILERLAALPVESWNYRWDDASVRHIGPMAQDFADAFGVGDGKRITFGDVVGVAIASLKALNGILEGQDRELDDLKAEVSRLREQIQQRK
jgi:hypothetical protein